MPEPWHIRHGWCRIDIASTSFNLSTSSLGYELVLHSVLSKLSIKISLKLWDFKFCLHNSQITTTVVLWKRRQTAVLITRKIKLAVRSAEGNLKKKWCTMCIQNVYNSLSESFINIVKHKCPIRPTTIHPSVVAIQLWVFSIHCKYLNNSGR